MGICDSVTNNKTKKKSNYSQTTRSTSDLDSRYILSSNLAIRDDINKYYSLKPQYIGHGASGMVYEATDKDGKTYAIKSINKASIKDIHNVVLEAEISLLLSHEYIVKCYSIFEDSKTVNFVLELIEGGDLFSFITTSPNGRLTDKDALILITQILQTIRFLHIEMNIIHRDIKPENFLVVIENCQSKIKMIDFGFSCYIPKDHFMNDQLGSPLYLAPEIVEGFPYNKNVDIWSAGVILFNMLTGTQPFSSVDREATNEDILYGKINFNEIDNIQLRELCKGMLERHPEFRLSAERAHEIALGIIINKPENHTEFKERHNTQMTTVLDKDCMKGVINLCNMNTYSNTLPDTIFLMH